MKSWKGTHVLIIGAARQGLALARFLSRQGADVTLNDMRSEDKLEPARQSMAGYPIHWALGGHPLELLAGIDVMCLSGGVPLDLPIVAEALRRGVPLSNDSQIFMEAVPCRVIGITGSAGKTTTTTLVSRMAQVAIQPPAKVWVGGNIGQPLVEFVDHIQPTDLAILELSSFQLEQMTLAPHISVVLNVTPNHLDRHGTLEAYTAAKARILTFQQPDDMAVLGRDDPGSWNLRSLVPGQWVSFGHDQPPAGETGTYFARGSLYLQQGTHQTKLMDENILLLRGDHNLLNALAACAIASAAGFPLEAMVAGITGFKGVAHRLEYVRAWNGATWYNDSIATAPERTMAAIRAFSEPLVLLLGGRDKNLPWQDLATLIHERVEHVVVFGEAAPKILAAIGPLQSGRKPFTLEQCAGLQEAVTAAARLAEDGVVVLLSPGGTSFDEFHDFEARGEAFRTWVHQLS